MPISKRRFIRWQLGVNRALNSIALYKIAVNLRRNLTKLLLHIKIDFRSHHCA